MPQDRKSPYGKYGVFGTPSYDFHSEKTVSAGLYSKAEQSAVSPRRHIKRKRSPAFAVAAILTLILLFCALMSQSRLVELSNETVAVQQEIDTLLAEQTRLKIRHGMSFSLADTEQYAIDVLGMQKPTAEQICYIDLDVSDAEDGAEEESSGKSILSLLREYFPG